MISFIQNDKLTIEAVIEDHGRLVLIGSSYSPYQTELVSSINASEL